MPLLQRQPNHPHRNALQRAALPKPVRRSRRGQDIPRDEGHKRREVLPAGDLGVGEAAASEARGVAEGGAHGAREERQVGPDEGGRLGRRGRVCLGDCGRRGLGFEGLEEGEEVVLGFGGLVWLRGGEVFAGGFFGGVEGCVPEVCEVLLFLYK